MELVYYEKFAKECSSPDEFFKKVCKFFCDIIATIAVGWILNDLEFRNYFHLIEIYGEDHENILSIS